MTRKLNSLLLFTALLLLGSTAFGQYTAGDNNYSNNKGEDQNNEWSKGKQKYPDKPRNMWEVGVNGGAFFVSGDVKAKFGYGFGAHIRKALGYTLSMRLKYNYNVAHGQNYEASRVAVQNNRVLQERATEFSILADQGLGGYKSSDKVYMNFRSKVHKASLQLAASLNNINFHKEKNKWDLFVFAGIGGMLYQTHYDQLDANGQLYDWNSLETQSTDPDLRKDAKELIGDLVDGTYETKAEAHRNEQMIGDNVFNPTANIGVGLGYRLSDRISLAIEQEVTYTNDDLVDGQRWAQQDDLTRDFDALSYTSLHLNVHLGSKKKRQLPLWWANPLDAIYEDVAKIKREKKKDPFVDADKDGVPDALDREPNSPEDCPVDTKGITLDSDADGIPDCQDKEPFSPPGHEIDEEGVHIKPEVEPIVAGVDETGCINVIFPMIHFDLDKDRIKAEFIPNLYYVASYLKKCPAMKVRVQGHTDVRQTDEYNVDLSQRRASNAYNYLVENFGVNPAQLVMDSEGETEPLIKGLPDNSWSPKYEPSQYMNRRVEFTQIGGE